MHYGSSHFRIVFTFSSCILKPFGVMTKPR